ncbi:hypothetical protein GCM10009753_64620 [Streptantibioticus ferralitis]
MCTVVCDAVVAKVCDAEADDGVAASIPPVTSAAVDSSAVAAVLAMRLPECLFERMDIALQWGMRRTGWSAHDKTINVDRWRVRVPCEKCERCEYRGKAVDPLLSPRTVVAAMKVAKTSSGDNQEMQNP